MTELKRIAIGLEGRAAIPMKNIIAKLKRKLEKMPKHPRMHGPNRCDPALPCPIHRPSDHAMKDWPYLVRYDKHAVTERICAHGIGHPDPDSLAWIERRMGADWAEALAVHGCDGCCA